MCVNVEESVVEICVVCGRVCVRERGRVDIFVMRIDKVMEA